MRELDRTKIYDLSELTSNEKNQLLIKLIEIDVSWDKELPKEEFFSSDFLYFSTDYVSKGEWLVSDEIQYTDKEIVNAKELFYTLEDIQVDCTNLTEKQIAEMCKVYESNGYKKWMDEDAFKLQDDYTYLRTDWENEFFINGKDYNKTTITYEKFMELFGYKEKSKEFKDLVEVLNEELTEEAYKETECEVKYIAEKPKQYQIGIDTFERCEANMTKEEILACVRFNIDKYNWRNKGQDLEDLEKIISYANWAIKQLKQNLQ